MTRLVAKRRSNDCGAPAGVPRAVVSFADEMMAFEQLGPRARRALDEAPIKILAAPVVAQVRALEAAKGQAFDMQDPELDRLLARGIAENALRFIAVDRGPDDVALGMTPMRPRRTLRR